MELVNGEGWEIAYMEMKNRPSILLPIATGFAVVFIVMLILLVAGYGQPGGLAKWLGLSQWLGSAAPGEPDSGMPLTQVIAVVDLFIALLAIAITTRLTRTRETALVQEIAQAEGTLDALVQGVIRLDAEGRAMYLNPAARRMLGEEPGRLPDQIKLIDQHTRQSLLPSLLNGNKGDEPAPLPPEARLITPQGIELEVEGSCRTIHNVQGKVQVAVLLLRDVTEEREWTRRQPDLWDRDSLTALPGRNFMINRLARIIERVRAGERPIAYIQITLDGIERVYREAGNPAGDALIRHLSGLLRAHMRDTDLLARMDEHEFGALLTICPQEVSDRITTDILSAMSTSHFNWEGTSYEITARLGRVQIPPFEGTVDELLAAAEPLHA